MFSPLSTLGDTDGLIQIHSFLASSASVAARVALALESASILLHCSIRWDQTTQLVSLASLLLDPHYRTFRGFQIVKANNIWR
ncbi:hypothetical protein ACHQM5_011424 [Ranunculus cassubicifolius]